MRRRSPAPYPLGRVVRVGAWRSLVAHLHGVQGVPSSNLGAPTNKNKYLESSQKSAKRPVYTLVDTSPISYVSYARARTPAQLRRSAGLQNRCPHDQYCRVRLREASHASISNRRQPKIRSVTVVGSGKFPDRLSRQSVGLLIRSNLQTSVTVSSCRASIASSNALLR
jgi:hypothetical protein